MNRRWNIDPSSGQDIVWGEDGTPVAQALGPDWPTNAPLIAAAPELLAAAKEALAILRGQGAPGWGVAKDVLGTAIAKAEGRS